jgi:AcrR family transcriptional regulator
VPEKPPSLRERKKRETRASLLNSASRLFHIHGYQAVTIDEVCEHAGVSRRTFFRYFPNKEALVFPNREMRLERFLALLSDSPATETPFDTLRRLTRIFGSEYMENREQLIQQQRLIASSPELMAREREIDADWEAALARTFLVKSPSGEDAELRARVIAGALIGVIRATVRHWYHEEGRGDLSTLGLEALECLERGFFGN